MTTPSDPGPDTAPEVPPGVPPGIPTRPKIAGVILAGGRSRRMGGGDKCLQPLGGEYLISHVVTRAHSQVDALAINASGDPARFADFKLPVIADSVEGFAGPLAGVLAGLDWAAAAAPDSVWLATFACDAPFFPQNLVMRFWAEAEEAGADLACARSRGRDHPVFGLWPLALRDALRQALVEDEIRKVDVFTARYQLVAVEFPDLASPWGPVDPFFNANRPEDLAEAERILSP
jgi:molybdopterin-guanine dinucleotide biosynthesis protein A